MKFPKFTNDSDIKKMRIYPWAAVAVLILGESIIDVVALLIDAISVVTFGTVVIAR